MLSVLSVEIPQDAEDAGRFHRPLRDPYERSCPPRLRGERDQSRGRDGRPPAARADDGCHSAESPRPHDMRAIGES